MESEKQKIDGIILSNKEIIQRILKNFTGMVTVYRYKLVQDVKLPSYGILLYRVEEQKETTLGQHVVNGWKCAVTFESIPDIFNNGLPYNSVQNLDDLLSLHEGMVDVLNRVATFLGEGLNSVPSLHLFRKNFEIVTECLQEVEALFKEPKTEIKVYEKKVQELNDTLLAIVGDPKVIAPKVQEGKQVRFLGFVNWKQDASLQTYEEQCKRMDDVCTKQFGASARAATGDEYTKKLIGGLPPNHGTIVTFTAPGNLGSQTITSRSRYDLQGTYILNGVFTHQNLFNGVRSCIAVSSM